MPVDDMVEWAAEGGHHGPPKAKDMPSTASAYAPQPITTPRTSTRRDPSPRPKNCQLPRWYDIGHCAAACSGRCTLHAPKKQEQQVANETSTWLPGVAESLHTPRRKHGASGRTSFLKSEDEDLFLSSGMKPTGAERKPPCSRLDLAREALLNGNADLARAIVKEEMERLGVSS